MIVDGSEHADAPSCEGDDGLVVGQSASNVDPLSASNRDPVGAGLCWLAPRVAECPHEADAAARGGFLWTHRCKSEEGIVVQAGS